jgi:hypothetical protein
MESEPTMSARRRVCRAFACPTRVDNRVLFCRHHWDQLGPKLQQPIIDNLEAPALAGPGLGGRVLAGVSNAQRVLAKKEGRARVHVESLRQAASTVASGEILAGEDTTGINPAGIRERTGRSDLQQQ